MTVRYRVRRLLICAIAVMAFCPAARSAAADPSSLVTQLGAQVREILSDTTLAPAERQQRLHDSLHDAFDFPMISRFVLGGYWQSSSESFRQEFSGIFEDYVIQSLSGRFGEYSGETMNVTAARAEGERSTVVSTTIVHPNGTPPAKVDWRVQNTRAGFKITDVSVSGISLALSYREQFTAVIDHDGGQVDALIPALRKKLDAQVSSLPAGNARTSERRP
jgi:phospholipid transport system substrate-binding protein